MVGRFCFGKNEKKRREKGEDWESEQEIGK